MAATSELRPWTRSLEEEVGRRLASEPTGHDRWHALRVRAMAAQIGSTLGADIDVVEAAALLHDIGHADGRAGHAQSGAFLAAEILSNCGFPAYKIPAVVDCIDHHHWRVGRAGDPQRPSAEYQAFADADRLDALGAIGIARAFAFGGAHHRPIWAPDADATATTPYGVSSIHHFYDKLLRLPCDMYTEPGRQLAGRRVAVMQDFLETFYLEWECQDVDAGVRASAPSRSLSSFAKRAI